MLRRPTSEAGARDRRVAPAAVAAVLGVALGTALSGSFAVADRATWHDATGDASPAFTDIRAIRHAHGKRGVLRHVIAVQDANAASRDLAQLEITASGDLYLIDTLGVTRLPQGSADAPTPATARTTASSPRVRIRRRGNRVIFAFHRSVIGKSWRYRWSATIGSNDTSPAEFDRAPDRGALRHVLFDRKRFRGYRAGRGGRPDRAATQGSLHRFVFVDRARERTRYALVLDGPGDARKRYRGRTNGRGRDAIEDSLYVNDVGGPGRWRAIWRVAGKRVAVFRFRLRPEFEG